ncbi:MAG: 2'-5' RNA ligase family protein [Gammaproteobacteria bacterium]|nr:2'-5' RNA ligase family protein [Gammaproteobacteria bacterium]
MTARLRNHSLWLMPEEAARARLDRIIEDLSNTHRTPRFHAHVTLLARVLQPAHDVVAKTQALAIAGKLPQLSLTLGSLAMTNAYFLSLFAIVDPGDYLLAAHERLKSCFHVQSIGAFTPHLSLLYGKLAEVDKHAIVARLHRRYPERFTAREIAVFDTSGAPEHWRQVGSVALTEP